MKKRLLIVEDEPDLRELIADQLAMENVEIFKASSAQEAFEIYAKQPIDIILSDIRLPEMDGVTFIRVIKSQTERKTDCYIMSGFSDYTEQEVLEAGAVKYFSKPAGLSGMVDELSEILKAG